MAAKRGNFEIQDDCETHTTPADVDPFKATQLWWAIVKYLKSNITLKRRRYKIKQYDECFSGENAVDVVYRCLCEEKKMHTLITNDITRAVATKVCQALLDNSIIEVIGAKSNHSNHYKFEDRSTKFYQFSREQSYVSQELNLLKTDGNRSCERDENTTSCNAFQESSEHLSSNTVVSCKDTSSSSAFSNSLENSKSWFNCTSPFQNANSCDSKDTSSHFSLKAGSIPHLIYQMHKIADNDSSQSLSTIPELKPKSRGRTRSAILCRPILRSLSPNQKGNIGAVRLTNNQENDQDVNHPETPHRVNIRRCLSTNNVTLDQIGMMDDDKNTRYFDDDKIWKHVALSHLLTVLDLPFLEDILQSPTNTLQKSDYQSVIPNYAVVAKQDSTLRNENLWIHAAQLITESKCFLLDNPIGLTDSQLKLQAFEKIRRYYHSLPSPIIPTNLVKVFISILGLIKQGSYSTAIHALRLAILLLPWQQRKELKQLLTFMQLTVDDKSVQLNPKVSNRQYVVHHFTPTILHYELLATNQAAILTSFLLHNHEMVLTPPPDIQLQVERLFCESKFQEVTSSPAITYCHPVMISSYEAQSKTTSYKALQELMNSVLDSTQLSLKEKEKWMKKFKKHHQDVYIHCYEGDI